MRPEALILAAKLSVCVGSRSRTCRVPELVQRRAVEGSPKPPDAVPEISPALLMERAAVTMAPGNAPRSVVMSFS